MDWYWVVLTKYAVFSGRVTRSEYWYFTLFNFLALIALSFVDGVLGSLYFDAGIGLLGGVYSLVVFLPYLAVTVRRLHDTDRSGWWLLIELIPIIGGLALFIFMVQDSQASDNLYGANPKPGNQAGSSSALVIATVVIVVIAAIGMLAAIAVPAYQNYVGRAKQAGGHQGQSI